MGRRQADSPRRAFLSSLQSRGLCAEQRRRYSLRRYQASLAQALGWSMVMVGFLGLTAHGQEGAQVQNNSAPAAANAVAATVNGQPILEAALQRGLKRLPPEKQAEARTEILEYLIDNVLIDQQLQQLRIEVAAKDVDARMEQIKGEIKKSNQTLEKALTKLGLTEDELRGQLTAEMRWEKYANEQITEKDVKEVFDKNPEIFDGSMVRARHILLTPPAGDAAAAEQAKQQLERDKQQIENEVAQGLAKLPATADAITRERERAKLLLDAFAALARKQSACPSKEQGGDMGWFPRAVSDVVTTQFGYHLILVTDRREGLPTKFEEVKDVARDICADRLREQLVAKLRPTAKIVLTPQAKP
ncbi:MAG: hypothetical protein E6K70_18730 [Planctomycetota bacterium]|nr:MAG: hypothetical protein E6K70_18730 [Planctomycetota bacterium]